MWNPITQLNVYHDKKLNKKKVMKATAYVTTMFLVIKVYST